MLRSLYSAISGLRNHQTRMDTIGNNISNVNTVGFKSSRVTFEEGLSQLIQGSTRGEDEGVGGTNPMQVGLGMNIGSIDLRMGQGSLENTGLITDLAIEGKGYFAVSDGNGKYFTRNGAFQFDSKGQMVLPTNGMVLQGKIADKEGEFQAGSLIGNIRIPFNDQAPAQASTEVDFARNLDSDSLAKGSIIYSGKYLRNTEATNFVVGLNDHQGNDLGIKAGDTLTLSADGVAGTATSSFVVTAGLTVAQLATNMTNFFRSAQVNAPGTSVDVVTVADNPLQAGALTIYGNGTKDIKNFQVTSSRPGTGPLVTKALAVQSTIPIGSARRAIITDTLRSPAQAGDLLSDLYDATGNALGLETGDLITVNGTVGGTPANSPAAISFVAGVGGTTMQELLNQVKDTFKLPTTDGTLQNNLSVGLNAEGSDDNIADGSIVVRGQPEGAFALKGVTINATDTNNTKPTPNAFKANNNMTTLRDATDTKITESAITVFDDIGKEHTMTMSFIPTSTPSQWLWEAKLSGQENISSGNKGKLSFGQDGSVSSFTYDGGGSQFIFDPRNGSRDVKMNLKVGGPRDFTGLTQFRSATTATAVGQDGFTMGRLRQISIGEDGVVSGSFTNGTHKNLAQVLIADFTNPGGLQKVKDSVYTSSSNSGDPIYGSAGPSGSSVIKPGALELSNVELAQEFTDMITTQRGYQANARVITTSDSMLEELISLKR